MEKFLVALSSLAVGCASYLALSYAPARHFAPPPVTDFHIASLETKNGFTAGRAFAGSFDGTSLSGNYLAGRFAQARHDWKKAKELTGFVLGLDPENKELLKRFMVLAMGSGEPETALLAAQNLYEKEKSPSLKEPLVALFLAARDFKNKNYAPAAAYLESAETGTFSDFMGPLVKAWAAAAEGKNETMDLRSNSIHVYHAILIADYLGKYDHIESLLQKSLERESTLTDPHSLENIADMYVHIGKNDKALKFYHDALEISPNDESLQEKIRTAQANQKKPLVKTIRSAEEGLAKAMYDMAGLLFQESSDETVRVFANLALYLDPGLSEANLLMAAVSARNEKYDEAITYYKTIGPDHDNFLEIRREIADLLQEARRTEEAIEQLEMLAKEYGDRESLIQIGDIYRRQKDFEQALQYYNRAAAGIDESTLGRYWHLYYVRGMAYEQAGNWAMAEQDLHKALEYQPDHPFILNYLGYAWADQGKNLPQSLSMIRKAVALRPADGYITDSLGWVLYRSGNYKESIPHLERAIELLPYDPVVNDHLGDAYWQVGRRLEARFQWQRAQNHADDDKLLAALEQKLKSGLKIGETEIEIIQKASSAQKAADTVNQ